MTAAKMRYFYFSTGEFKSRKKKRTGQILPEYVSKHPFDVNY